MSRADLDSLLRGVILAIEHDQKCSVCEDDTPLVCSTASAYLIDVFLAHSPTIAAVLDGYVKLSDAITMRYPMMAFDGDLVAHFHRVVAHAASGADRRAVQ